MEESMSRRVVDLSDDDLANAGLPGDGECFANRAQLTLFMLECQNLASRRPDDPPPWAPFSQISSASDPVAPHLVSEFERINYWHGISFDPPELLYRSDLESNPFPVPVLAPGTHWFTIPAKTAEGVFETPLNAVWHVVAPMIVALLKKRGIKYSALKTARFSTRDEDGKKTLGPIVIWIATHPKTTSAESARDASPDILHILEEHGVQNAVVEWYEGSVERLSGPTFMRVVSEWDPTSYVRRPFTTVLGMPIASKQTEVMDTQGTVSFFFHESKDKNGKPSARVLGVSNQHVLCADSTVDYQYKGNGLRRYVGVCGLNRFQRFLYDTRALIAEKAGEAVMETKQIIYLEEPKAKSQRMEEDKVALERKREDLRRLKVDNLKLQAFFLETSRQWNDMARRTIGFVDWAPSISVDVDDRHYTRDIATIELDSRKFKDHFRGNVVNIGSKFGKFGHYELKSMFWPNSTPPQKKIFYDGLLEIRGVVTHELLVTPCCYDKDGDPIFIVGKNGNTTDFTVGRHAGLEAYLCDESGRESVEVAIYNYDRSSGSFSAKGDSGALIFTGDGRMLAILHSAIGKGHYSHVSFGTPAWWVIEQLKTRYPHADFDRTSFFPDQTS
ncbi:transmembrane protein [Ceratobasidium sp. AG-Ba]|nr:transmembrane protein [Ceratobasidium sp. AG-Ba]